MTDQCDASAGRRVGKTSLCEELAVIALALTAPVLGFGLLLTLQWFEERVMSADAGPVSVQPRS